jgi:hypothetical protein
VFCGAYMRTDNVIALAARFPEIEAKRTTAREAVAAICGGDLDKAERFITALVYNGFKIVPLKLPDGVGFGD